MDIPCHFLKKHFFYCCFYLFLKKQSDIEKGKNNKKICLLVHSPNVHSTGGRPGQIQEPGIRNFVQISKQATGTQVPGPSPVSRCISRVESEVQCSQHLIQTLLRIWDVMSPATAFPSTSECKLFKYFLEIAVFQSYRAIDT